MKIMPGDRTPKDRGPIESPVYGPSGLDRTRAPEEEEEEEEEEHELFRHPNFSTS